MRPTIYAWTTWQVVPKTSRHVLPQPHVSGLTLSKLVNPCHAMSQESVSLMDSLRIKKISSAIFRINTNAKVTASAVRHLAKNGLNAQANLLSNVGTANVSVIKAIALISWLDAQIIHRFYASTHPHASLTKPNASPRIQSSLKFNRPARTNLA